MDQESYDGTEKTPVPTPFRPPPPSHRAPWTSSNQFEEDDHNETRNEASALNNTLFSLSGGDSLLDELEESVMSPSVAPPSPLSRRSGSLYGEDGTSKQAQQKRYSRPHSASYQSKKGYSVQPPIAEVHVENEDESFFECFEDRSLAERARKSLEQTAEKPKQPQHKQKQQQQQQKQQPRSQQSMLHNTRRKAAYEDEQSTSSSLDYHTTTKSSSLDDATGLPSSDDVARVHENALHALMRLKEELLKANDKSKTLERENIAKENDKTTFQIQIQNLQRALGSLKETNMTLQYQNDALMTENQVLKEERTNLQENLRRAAREKKEHMHRKLATDNRNKELRIELDKLKNDLEEAMAGKQKLSSDLSSAQHEREKLQQENSKLLERLEAFENQHSNETIQQMELEIAAKNEELSKVTTELRQWEEKCRKDREKWETSLKTMKQQRQEENERYQKEIERLSTALKSRSTSGSVIYPMGGKSPRGSASSGSVRFRSEVTSPVAGMSLESSISERLARMRDSAERAHLIKAHKREITRLKLQKETELKELASAHEAALRKAQKEADSRWSSKLDELKSTLQRDYEEKLEEIETVHTKKFTEMQEKYMRSQQVADESLEDALTKIAAVTQQYEREASRRIALERSVDQLNVQYDREKEQLHDRHLNELEKRRSEWELERDTLLSVIQNDCNSAFEKHRSMKSRSSPLRTNASSRPSPIAVDTDYFSSKLTVETSRPNGPLPDMESSPSLVSPSYSDIDSFLKETEDLLQSIM